jgi:hypothetical protein
MKDNRKYHWVEWFKKKEFHLTPGADFRCSTQSMIGQIRNAASFHGLKLWVRLDHKLIRVSVLGPRPTKENGRDVRRSKGNRLKKNGSVEHGRNRRVAQTP